MFFQKANPLILFLIFCCMYASTEAATSEFGLLSYPSAHSSIVKGGGVSYACIAELGYDSINSYQKDKGLDVDGVVGKQTWKAIVEDFENRGLSLDNKTAPLKLSLLSVDGEKYLAIDNIAKNTVVFKAQGTKDFTLNLIIKISGRTGGMFYNSGKTLPVPVPNDKRLEAGGRLLIPIRNNKLDTESTNTRAHLILRVPSIGVFELLSND